MSYDIAEFLEYASFRSGFEIPCCKDDGGIDLLAKSYCGDTLLHAAVGMNDLDAVRYLLGAGLDLNARGDLLMTPLYQAASSKEVDMVELLLKLGADPTIPDHRGNLPNIEILKRATQQDGPSKLTSASEF